MDKPEPLAMLGIQDTWRNENIEREKQQQKAHGNNKNWKDEQYGPH